MKKGGGRFGKLTLSTMQKTFDGCGIMMTAGLAEFTKHTAALLKLLEQVSYVHWLENRALGEAVDAASVVIQ